MKIMRVVAAAAMLLLLAACAETRWSPQMELSPDGRTVAFFSDATSKGGHTVALLDRSTGTVSSVPLPGGKPLDHLMWMDQRLYAGIQNITYGDCELLDALQHTWTPAPQLRTIWYPPFVGTYQGQPVLFVPEETTEIRSLTDLSIVGKISYPVRGVGDGYMMRYHWPAGSPIHLSSFGWFRESGGSGEATTWRGVGIDSMELLDPEMHVIMTIDAAQAAKLNIPLTDGEAQLSPDHRTLLLAPLQHGPSAGSGWPSLYPRGFALLDAATANCYIQIAAPMPHRTLSNRRASTLDLTGLLCSPTRASTACRRRSRRQTTAARH